MGLRRQRVPQKDDKINLIILNLRPHLLLAAKMSGQIFMDIEIGYLLDQTACRRRGKYLMLAQYSPVGDTKILHQNLFGIVGD